jgi:hypothetical protein
MDAQKELGLDSAAHVPVKYSREVGLRLVCPSCLCACYSCRLIAQVSNVSTALKNASGVPAHLTYNSTSVESAHPFFQPLTHCAGVPCEHGVGVPAHAALIWLLYTKQLLTFCIQPLTHCAGVPCEHGVGVPAHAALLWLGLLAHQPSDA